MSTFQSSEAKDGGEWQYPREGWQGLPALPQRQIKPSGILFPLPCFWLEVIPTIPGSLKGSHQASVPERHLP